MIQAMNIHYLEIVTPDVNDMVSSYAESLDISFSEPVLSLGGAYTAALSTGGMIGIRAPMHESEEPVTRPYSLVDDIELSVASAVKTGAIVALPPTDISGYGKCAVLMQGGVQIGLWQM
ncbi:VOC family protein [Glaciecola petra]|uniref:Hydroxylase n=1 Tax=Glaciecola petra TaxID=3075602 RepID=A0ABU2ZLF3_9ALTE|nr:hydroxylase [Aestuariibacter sp. P117]MDT0593226.1 hydroxylase [Aestuariibacter sp. P117]